MNITELVELDEAYTEILTSGVTESDYVRWLESSYSDIVNLGQISTLEIARNLDEISRN